MPGGKLNRGMAVYDVLAAIKGKSEMSADDIFKANALGWCIEWVSWHNIRHRKRSTEPPTWRTLE